MNLNTKINRKYNKKIQINLQTLNTNHEKIYNIIKNQDKL
jgi:hypothetical protein